MMYQYHHAVVAGTFDRIHKGHRKLLAAAFHGSQHVTVGVTTEELYANKVASGQIQDYKTREAELNRFLTEKNFITRASIIPIYDFYGNSLDDRSIDSIYVTENTLANAQKINDERKKKNMDSLAVIIVEYALDNSGQIISSERIRKGEIDREGNSYSELFQGKKQYLLAESEKEAFRTPIGPITTDMEKVIRAIPSGSLVIAVGDIVSISIQQAGRIADISIIDNKSRRQILEPTQFLVTENSHKRSVHNPAGSITAEAVTNLREAISDFEATHAEQLIVVSGEEDLLTIPAVLLAPLHTVVLYGQFDKGIVVVTVSEQNKKHVQNLFRKFQ